MKSKLYTKREQTALDLWVKLARCYGVFSRFAAEDIRSSGLTPPQFAVVECLGHLGPLPLGKVCEKMLVSGGNLTLIADNLEKQGLVERIFSKEDRRTVTIALTKKGQKLFEQIFPAHAACVTDLASVLTTAEQAQLAKLLKKLGLGISERKK